MNKSENRQVKLYISRVKKPVGSYLKPGDSLGEIIEKVLYEIEHEGEKISKTSKPELLINYVSENEKKSDPSVILYQFFTDNFSLSLEKGLSLQLQDIVRIGFFDFELNEMVEAYMDILNWVGICFVVKGREWDHSSLRIYLEIADDEFLEDIE